MLQQLQIQLGDSPKKCILGGGFYRNGKPTRNLHKHNYGEIHVLAKGSAVLEVEMKQLQLQAGDVVLIPEGLLHMFTAASEDVQHTAFLVESHTRQLQKHSQPTALLELFMEQISRAEATGNMTRVAAYISLLCSDFFPETAVKAEAITDHAFLIHNYFSRHYSQDASLEELAQQLHFSQRQTARLVQQYTGKPFKQAIIDYRMSVAHHLAQTTDLSLAQIAPMVGYSSYNGFWKAYTQYQEEKA